MYERTIKLDDKAADIFDRKALLSATAIRMAAREEIKLLNRDQRREIVDMWNARRKLCAQIEEREVIDLR